MYQTLRSLIDESVDAYLYEDADVLNSNQHILSRHQVQLACSQAKNEHRITEDEHDLLSEYLKEQFSLIDDDMKIALIELLVDNPYFEVIGTKNTKYLSTKSIKSDGFQVTKFIESNNELIAWSDKQCSTIESLVDALYSYGIAYNVYRYLTTSKRLSW